MAAINNNYLGPPVTTRTINYGDMVRREWGAEYNKPDTAYEFSSGTKMDSTDRTTNGFYKPA